MYNTKYIITYNDENVFNENDNITEKDKEFVRDALYRNDILHIFDIDDFDVNIINDKIDELFKELQKNSDFLNILKKFANVYLSEDPIIGLYILFTYDILCIAHPCICEYLEKGEISEDNLNKLNKLLI